MSRCAFTVAIGKPMYLKMAIALARSFLRHNSSLSIGFAIVTDRPRSEKPRDLELVNWIEISEEAYGCGFVPKLYLDKLAPADCSLFIDADCLVVGSLEPAFQSFAGRPVSVLGRPIRDGEWFGDIKSVVRKLGIEEMPRFNGGVYYLEPGRNCTAVYDTARDLLLKYDEIGFVRLRGYENDEVLMSAALAIHGLSAMVEDGKIMHTTLEAPGGMMIDTLLGRAILYNPKHHPKHFSWMPLEVMYPAIVHFLGTDPEEHPYRTEIRKLELVARGYGPRAAIVSAIITSAFPWFVLHFARNALRPAYHALFGVRPVRKSSR